MESATFEQLIEACGPNVYLDINTEAGNEARKIVRGAGMNAIVYFGKGKTIEEALQNLYKELKDKNVI